MDDLLIARILHVIAIVMWIGGVGMVTTVVLPALCRRGGSSEFADVFAQIEHRFARQARWTVLLAGLSGFYMVYRLDLWHRFGMSEYWWMHAMLGLWLLFSVLLFALEPLFLHAWFERRTRAAPDRTLSLAVWFHRGLLAASLVTIAGAIAGIHG